MATQSLIWTALPNGLTSDGASLRVSVLLSPRLHAGVDPQKLQSFFPDWQDWPSTLAKGTVDVRHGAAMVSVPLSQTLGPNRVDTTLGSPTSADWFALFPPDLFVEGFTFRDLTQHTVLSYDTGEVVSLVRGLYSKLAARADDSLPTISDLADDGDWKSVVQAVATLDRRFHYPRTGLRNTKAMFEEYARTGLKHDQLIAMILGRFQLFHTPPATPEPVTRARTDDQRISATWMQYKRATLPAKADFAKTLDFHQVVAAMNAYPTMLRRLGLVVDLVLDRAAFTNAANAALSATVRFPAGALKVPATPSASPRLHVRLSKTHFEAVSNPALGPADARIAGRLLALDPKVFDLIGVDADGAGLKLMNVARSIGRQSTEPARIDAVTRFEKEMGAPSLRTAGLMLVHKQRDAMLKQRFTASKKQNDAAMSILAGQPAAPPPELWAEDVLRGFRIDIWDRTTGLWRSLCERSATYDLGGGQTVTVPAEETTVRMATTRSADESSNQHVIYLHEVLVSWAGWSLGAPPPGRAVTTDDKFDTTTAQTEAELPPGLNFRSTFQPIKGSLPRLRFGREYWIRARAVDLAGNSLAPNQKDYGTENPASRARAYLRYEPVVGPVVALVRPSGQPTERPHEGESMERLAIRTFGNSPGVNPPSTEVARRYVLPVQSTVRDAEQHGKLDVAGKVASGLFTMLATQDRDASDPASALQQEVLPMQGPLDPVPVNTTFAVYREGESLTYLPDALASEVAVRVFGHPNISDTTLLTIPLYPTGAWPEARPFTVRVFEDASAQPSYDALSHTLLVPLPKAIRARVRLSMRMPAPARALMGLWHWLTPAQQKKIEKLVDAGQHWMFTPWRTLEVVHAVQRPLIAPEMSKVGVARFFHATSARPQFFTTCSLKSTDRLDLRAEWHEPQDDPSDPAALVQEVDRPRGDVAFQIKVTDPARYALKIAGQKRGGFAEHTFEGDDLIGVGVIGHDLVTPKYHEFHDTRYRRVEYWLVATTSFREFLPPALLTEDVGGQTVATDKHVHVEGPKVVQWVPSSAAPPAPEVLYVVPTYGWVRTTGPDGRRSSWRRGGGLRIYLDRPWNVSGYGEMLAVVLPPAAFTGEPNTAPAGNPYKGYATQWGNDPVWLSPFVAGVAPARSAFPLARTAPDPSGSWLPAGAQADEAKQLPGAFQVTNLFPPGLPTSGPNAAPVEIAPHDVFYDADRRLWYCDIEIDQGASYYPFIRLALARYQPTSVPLAHLSPVVLADFMPLTADRWLNVGRTPDPKKRTVAVFGRRPTGSSGHNEAAMVAETTVVEVWVEKLIPAQGEDFGWHRVPPAMVAHATSVRPVRPRPAQAVNRARKLLAERDFRAIVSLDLVDAVLGFFRLWEGSVTLPEAPGASRYRLVIAEYEEYPVDDATPYAPPVSAKGRRLVFVEHVELD